MAIEKIKLADFVALYEEGPLKFGKYVKTLEPHINEVKAAALKFNKDMAAETKGAKEREDGYKKMNNARFFIKLQSGVSDVLKAKCLPLIKATETAIADAVKGSKDVRSIVVGIAVLVDHLTAPSGCTVSVREMFVTQWNEGICGWEAAEKAARAKVDAAKVKEKKATAVLNNYLKDKQAMKELGGDDYKAFKKQYEDLAKTL